MTKISVGRMEDIEGVDKVEVRGNEIIIICDGNRKLQIIEDIKSMGVVIEDFRTTEPSVEDVFVKLLEGEK